MYEVQEPDGLDDVPAELLTDLAEVRVSENERRVWVYDLVVL